MYCKTVLHYRVYLHSNWVDKILETPVFSIFVHRNRLLMHIDIDQNIQFSQYNSIVSFCIYIHHHNVI